MTKAYHIQYEKNVGDGWKTRFKVVWANSEEEALEDFTQYQNVTVIDSWDSPSIIPSSSISGPLISEAQTDIPTTPDIHSEQPFVIILSEEDINSP